MSTSSKYSVTVVSQLGLPALPVEELEKLSAQRLYEIYKLVRKTCSMIFCEDNYSYHRWDDEERAQLASNLYPYRDTIKRILDTSREHIQRKPKKAQYIKPAKRKSHARKLKARQDERKNRHHRWWLI